jgi:hypothetical protein
MTSLCVVYWSTTAYCAQNQRVTLVKTDNCLNRVSQIPGPWTISGTQKIEIFRLHLRGQCLLIYAHINMGLSWQNVYIICILNVAECNC